MAAQAREYLEKEGYAPLDMWGSKAKLSYTLLLLLHAVPLSILPKGIRAVATLLECEEKAHTTDIITATILRKIDPALESLEKVADQAQGAASDTRMAVDRMYRRGEETRDELQKGVEAANEDIQRAMECLKAKVSKLIENTVEVMNDSNESGDRQENGGWGASPMPIC